MEGDPKKLAMLILGKPGGGEQEGAEESDGDEGASTGGPEAFASAVKLAMKGDKQAAFDALKVAVSHCSEEEY